ncbi:MAG: hypothetical protein HFE84_07705 [Lachnospiraceae bacterium]|nr:hypothetical protein [Lachnospiraceae bacterium]
MKKIMAVYDEDPFYAERLSDYINRKERGIFKAQAFTSKESLAEYSRGHEIDVLLTGDVSDFEGTDTISTRQKLYLTGDEHTAGPNCIYKYQSGDDIIREVMAVYCELPEAAAIFPGLKEKGKQIVGIYSPVNRCGKTSLALAVGQLLAKEEKVLFVCLDSFTGFTGLIDECWKRDLSDLIYYYKQGRYNAIRLNSVIYYLGDMAWLPPIRFPEDFNQISSGEMAEMMAQILKGSDYETLVLDIGDYGKQVTPLLEICQMVYMPVREDAVSRAKLREFEEYLEAAGKRGLKEKLQELHVPIMTGLKRMEHFPQELLWGDMGDFVRKLLKGQRDLWENENASCGNRF